jgi:hypothetical protein
MSRIHIARAAGVVLLLFAALMLVGEIEQALRVSSGWTVQHSPYRWVRVSAYLIGGVGLCAKRRWGAVFLAGIASWWAIEIYSWWGWVDAEGSVVTGVSPVEVTLAAAILGILCWSWRDLR